MMPFDGYEEEDYGPDFMKFVIDVESIQAKALGEWMLTKFKIGSVIDLGCGPGLYLLPYKKAGADVMGLDAAKAGGGMLGPSEYYRADLRFKTTPGFRRDLVICFETAEHLHEEFADTLIESICACSDLVLFTGATPGQGGTNHHNEQPHEYWLAKFAARDYTVHPLQDEMRAMLAQFEPERNKAVSGWIMDNSFLLTTQEKAIAYQHTEAFDYAAKTGHPIGG